MSLNHCSLRTESLLAHYKQYGEIVDGIVMTDKMTGRPRGFGFVTYAKTYAARNSR